MKKTIALALVLALGAGAVHADDKKADEKKSTTAKKKEKQQHASGKSDKNFAQKAESDIGHWARKNNVWGKPRPGD